MPAGFEILSCAPSIEQLDSSKAESDALLGKVLMVRFEHYGWCKGTITGKVVDRRRTINKEAINFIAEFDIDDGASTDLSLDVSEYDPSPSADYQSWLRRANLQGAGRGGRGLGRLGCVYNDLRHPAACWMPVVYLGARVYVVDICPMLRTLTR